MFDLFSYNLIIVLMTEKRQKIVKYEMISPSGMSAFKQRQEKHEIWLELRFVNEDEVKSCDDKSVVKGSLCSTTGLKH